MSLGSLTFRNMTNMFVCLQSDHIFPCGEKTNKQTMRWLTGAVLTQSSAEP